MNSPRHMAWSGATTRSLRIIGLLCLVGLALLVQGCSTVSLGYNRAQGLVYWWLDGLADLDDAQSHQVRDDLMQLHQWHRREALPGYADLLQRWQGMAMRDISAEQACRELEAARGLLLDIVPRATPPLAHLASTMQPAQVAHLKRQHDKSNQKFRDEQLRSPQQGLEQRVDRWRDRLEMFYGALDAEQRRLLREQLSRSSFDPAQMLAERERRQADMVQTIVAARGQPVEVVVPLVRATLQRMVESPVPTYRNQSRAWTQEGCALLASVHNRASPAQRQAAVDALQGYRADFLRLAQQD